VSSGPISRFLPPDIIPSKSQLFNLMPTLNPKYPVRIYATGVQVNIAIFSHVHNAPCSLNHRREHSRIHRRGSKRPPRCCHSGSDTFRGDSLHDHLDNNSHGASMWFHLRFARPSLTLSTEHQVSKRPMLPDCRGYSPFALGPHEFIHALRGDSISQNAQRDCEVCSVSPKQGYCFAFIVFHPITESSKKSIPV
jgi:hypothetical protein